jgi:hypothetical protein
MVITRLLIEKLMLTTFRASTIYALLAVRLSSVPVSE